MNPNMIPKLCSEKNIGSDLVLHLSTPIGKGDLGTVYIGSYLDSDKWVKVAIKMIPTRVAFSNEEDILREINTLSQVKSENVVKFYCVKRTLNNIYIINQYCNGGSLAAMLKECGKLEENTALKIIKQIAQAFMCMSNLKDEFNKHICIVHRDLKPDNVMFNDGVVKIIDFGFARAIET